MYDSKLYQRLIAKVRKDEATGCWIWQGFVHVKRRYPGNRYGTIGVCKNGIAKNIHTHRAMWIALNGPLIREQCVCHRCDVPTCINPDHLFIGTHKENMADSRKKGRHYLSAKTHCLRGHHLIGANVYVCSKGLRHCKVCKREKQRAEWHSNPKLRDRQNELRRRRRAEISAGAKP